MSDEQDDTALEKRIRLPEPDVKNITVLTENLPNEPVLPWHRFDSPWLNRDDEADPGSTAEDAIPAEDADLDNGTEQLSLELETTIFSERVVLPDEEAASPEAAPEEACGSLEDSLEETP